MSDTAHPPLRLAAALDVALALPGCASHAEGARALGDRMAQAFFDRLDAAATTEKDAAYLAELTAALWGASVALVEAQAKAADELEQAHATVAKSREALDRLAGVGRLGVNGWLARAGGLVAGFSVTQVIAELAEHEKDVAIVTNESGALLREIEIAIVGEMREPKFVPVLAISLLVAVAAAVGVGTALRRHRRRRIAALSALLTQTQCAMTEKTRAQRERIVNRLVSTLVVVMERHYPGSAAGEIEAATGLSVSAAELADGSCAEAIAAFAARHLSADSLCEASG